MTTKKSRDTIQSLETGISILDAIGEAGRPLRFAEIQEITQITKSNLYKYMNTLTQLKLVIRDRATGQYHLGSKLITFGMTALGNQDAIALVTPYLQAISQYSNNTVLFAVGTSRGPVIAKIWNSEQILNIGAQLGTLLPPNSSSGKIYRAFYNQNGLESVAENGEEKIKTQQIAFADEPLVSSISSVSIPVFTFNKELAGIITVVGFSPNTPSEIDDPVSQYLLDMKKEISEVFGYLE
ncbi:IclR family transcriptional regulator [Virgibacillus ainsalahensis]